MAIYDIQNAEKWRGTFKHPWFYESTYRKLMENFDEEYVHIISTKTGIIFQFRLSYYSHYGYKRDKSPNCILLTSTNEDTFFIPKHGDIQRALLRVLKAGTPVSSPSSYTGKVCFGEKFAECWTHLQNTLNKCELEITPTTISYIWDELWMRRELRRKNLI